MDRIRRIEAQLGDAIATMRAEIAARIKYLKEEPDGQIQWDQRQTEWLAIKALQHAQKLAQEALEIVSV